jgi:hypothetical protein
VSSSLWAMSLVRRAGVLLAVAVLAVGLSTAPAGGAKKRKGKAWASEITLVHAAITLVHAASTQFSGRVSSNLKACRAQRLVTVFYTDSGTGQTLPLSVQRTDKQGGYLVSLPKPAFAGTYHAEVTQQKIRALRARQTCRAARSATVAV